MTFYGVLAIENLSYEEHSVLAADKSEEQMILLLPPTILMLCFAIFFQMGGYR